MKNCWLQGIEYKKKTIASSQGEHWKFVVINGAWAGIDLASALDDINFDGVAEDVRRIVETLHRVENGTCQ